MEAMYPPVRRGGCPLAAREPLRAYRGGSEGDDQASGVCDHEGGTWLTEVGCTHVAMEATGVYWEPVWHILENESSLTPVLANAQHIRNVPGRKSDPKDAAWIADLLPQALMRGSFVPPAPIQELRDLTRTRKQTDPRDRPAHAAAAETLEDANVKLDARGDRHPGRAAVGRSWRRSSPGRPVATVSPGAKVGATAPYGYAGWLLIEAGDRQPRSLAEAFRQPLRALRDRSRARRPRAAGDAGPHLQAREVRKVVSVLNATELTAEQLAAWAGSVVREGTV